MRMNSTVRGTFCRLLHLLSRGMDWFLQVRTVTWGGGKISSTHPYNAGESETRQLVQSLSEVPGKPRALAVPNQRMSPKAKEQVEMASTACWDGLLRTTWLPSLPLMPKYRPPSTPNVSPHSPALQNISSIYTAAWGRGSSFVWSMSTVNLELYVLL